MERNKILFLSVFTALLFHVCGLIGMFTEARPWFVSMTPLTLIIMTILIIWNIKTINREFILFFIACFSVGYTTEVIGTNTGLLFGEYSYGTAMGLKVFEVPLLIGIQWFVTVYSIGHTVLFGYSRWKGNVERSLSTNLWLIILASGLTTLFDFILEPAAISLGYWSWTIDGHVPLFNYICWFFISGLLLVPFFLTRGLSNQVNIFAVILIFIQTLFFIILSL